VTGPRFLGAHMPTGKGLGDAVRRGQAMGCTAIQVFTSSPRMWKGSPADPAKEKDLRAATAETHVPILLSHDTYLVNLCAVTEGVPEKSLATLIDEMTRCAAYGIPMVVSHLGAEMGQDRATAYGRVAEAVKEVLAATPESVTLLAETTAGHGSSFNVKLEDLAYLLELTQAPARLGVCLDTCHIFSAGYDIRTAEGLDSVIQEFDRVVGLDRLRAIHLNDSKFGLGTRKDRHENIGKGEIGLEAFRALINHPQLTEVPMFLETPTEEDGHEKDLTLLKSLVDT